MSKDETAPEELELTQADDRLHPTKTARPAGASRTAPVPASIGQYRILKKLGEGGMGMVYEAQQEHPKRKVAVKIIRGGQFVDEQRVRLFQREADTLARLKHADIAAIYESGRTEDGQHFFAMELVRGETLDAYLKKRPEPLTQQELELRLRLFRKIADAVHYAHQRGVIHRDLKPSNIIVTEEAMREDSSAASGVRLPEIKILDFGLARITEGDVAATTMATEMGVIKGTLPYMSPEQARGDPEEIDVRTDVYSLGVILYELLTGSRPYDVLRKSLAEAVRVICEDSPRPLKQTWSGVRRPDQDIETILGKALEKAVDRRYASAAALSEDIDRWLTSQPILARPPSIPYQVRKFARRNRVLVVGAAAICVALAAGTVVSSWQAVRATKAETDASTKAATAERVSEFLANMLGDVDPQVLGFALWDDLRGRVAEVRRARGASEDEIEVVLGSLGDALSGVNATDTALHLLDEQVLARAGETIQRELAEEPRIAGRLEHTIGETYRRLGLYEPAERHALHAVETRRGALGAEHPDTLASTNSLAVVYDRQGRYDEAEKLHRETLEIARRVFGQGHPDTLHSMNNLAATYRDQGRYDEAESLFRETLELRRRVLGQEHPDTLMSMNNLAVAYRGQGRTDEAEKLYREALGIQRRVLGQDHPDTLLSMNNLAGVYWHQGRTDEAEGLHRETLEIRKRVLGRDHPTTLKSMHNLALAYRSQGRYAEAEKLQRETLEIARRVLGQDHPGTLLYLNNLAWLLLTRKPASSREPETALQLAVELAEKTRYKNPNWLDTLSLAYHLSGDTAKAIEIQRKAISLLPEDADRSDYEERLAEFEAALQVKSE